MNVACALFDRFFQQVVDGANHRRPAGKVAQTFDIVAQHIDAADDFVAGHNGKLGICQLAINDVQVGAAHPTRRHPHSDLSGCRPRIGSLHQSERFARPFQDPFRNCTGATGDRGWRSTLLHPAQNNASLDKNL